MSKIAIAQRRASAMWYIQVDMSCYRKPYLRLGTDEEKLGNMFDACAKYLVSKEPDQYAMLTRAQRKALIAAAIEHYNEYIQN